LARSRSISEQATAYSSRTCSGRTSSEQLAQKARSGWSVQTRQSAGVP
jgi:hypothetical protein